MSITITIEGHDAQHARREMLALLGQSAVKSWQELISPEQEERQKAWARSNAIVAKEEVTAGEIVDALHGALKAETAAEDADGVEFPAAAAEPPKKRGRPRKEAPVVDAEPAIASYVELPDDITGQEIAEKFADVRSGQIDIEDVIAGQTTEEFAPQPEDPAVGWTIQDARNAGRALLDRAPDVDTGNRKLAATLVPFGVQQVKALQPDQIEAFVVATQKAVF